MNTKRHCLVGHDYDDDAEAFGCLIYLIFICIAVAIILAIVVYGGAFIGGFHSIKNYILAFKHNVVDSNLKPSSIF